MKAHGQYKIALEGNIVHVYPHGGFNEEGVKEIREQVLLVAPKNKPWTLFEHPNDLAGLTPEALEALLVSYKCFSKLNCKVIALEICSTWKGVIINKLTSNLDIPFYLSSDVDELNKLIKLEH